MQFCSYLPILSGAHARAHPDARITAAPELPVVKQLRAFWLDARLRGTFFAVGHRRERKVDRAPFFINALLLDARTPMTPHSHAFARDDEGQDLLEYALLVALIALVAIVWVGWAGIRTGLVFTEIANRLAQAV
jgi:Flp pilus assembly pilin Flp